MRLDLRIQYSDSGFSVSRFGCLALCFWVLGLGFRFWVLGFGYRDTV